MTAEDHLSAEHVLAHDCGASHVRIYGHAGPAVTILPSLGRGVEDFTEAYRCTLTTRLVEAGFRVVLIAPRGTGSSRGDLRPERASMAGFAADIADTLDALDMGRVHMVGHAFGNRLARTFATLYPDRVAGLVLLAAGGNFAMSEAQKAALRAAIDPSGPDAVRLEAIGRAFFARGNDPSVWLGGWYPDLARAQIMAARMLDGAFFKAAGGKPFLLVQPAEDFAAPAEAAGRVLAAELGAQVTYVEMPGCGHALTSERPDAVADAVIPYLHRR